MLPPDNVGLPQTFNLYKIIPVNATSWGAVKGDMSVESSLWQKVKERGCPHSRRLTCPSLLPRCRLHCLPAPFALALPPSHGHEEKVDQEQVPRCLVARQWCCFLRLGGSDCSMTLSLEQIHRGHFSGSLLCLCRTGKKPKKSNMCFEKCTMQWKTVSDAGAAGMTPAQRRLRDRKNCCEFIQPLSKHINKTPQWHVTSCLLISEEPPPLRSSNIYRTSHKMLYRGKIDPRRLFMHFLFVLHEDSFCHVS